MNIYIDTFQVFLLVLVRIGGMFVVAPFFSSQVILPRVKVLLAVFVALIMLPLVIPTGYQPPNNLIMYGTVLLGELLIGIILGFFASILFTAFQMAGQFFSMQMGFGISEVFDPVSQISIPVIGQFQSLIAILVFLYINGHHSLILGLQNSFEILPISQFYEVVDWGILTKSIGEAMSKMFIVALQLAFPMMGTAFLITISFGMLAKAAPQMNILMLEFPLKILVGLFLIWMVMPFFCEIVAKFLNESYHGLNGIFDGSFSTVWEVFSI